MKHNVGGWDQSTRFILGSAAILAAVAAPIPKGWRFGLLSFALAQLLTASTRYCPVNHALGIDTRKQDLAEAADEAMETAAEIA